MRTIITTLRLATAGLALALASGTVSAQGAGADFRWQKQLGAGQEVSLRNINGSVTVTAASGNQVEVIGHRRSGRAEDSRVEVLETADGVVICALVRGMRCEERGVRGRNRDDGDWDDDRRARMDLEVRIPRGLRLDASSVSGDVSVTGVQGPVKVSSVSGDVAITGGTDEVRAGSVSGDVVLRGLRVSRLSASTVSGELEVSVDQLTGDEDLSFSSVSGNVDLTLPRNFGADLRMTSVSGSIDSSFPITLDGRMDRRRVEGRIGNGGRRLTVTTVSGDLRLRSGT